MTVEEIIREAFEDLGEPPDIVPWTEAADGTLTEVLANLTRWYRWVDEAQKAVAGWKGPGRSAKWRGFFGEAYFLSLEKTIVLARASSGRNLYLTGNFTDGGAVGSNTITDDLNKYRGYVVEIDSVQYLVEESYYDAATAGQVLVLDNVPLAAIGDTVTVRRRTYTLTAIPAGAPPTLSLPWVANQPYFVTADGGPLEIVDVVDVEYGTSLDCVSFAKLSRTDAKNIGTPATYRKDYTGLTFDIVPEDARQFKVIYKRYPKPVIGRTSIPEVLDPFHYGMVLWCEWRGLVRSGEATKAYAMQQNFDKFMTSRQGEFDLEDGLTPKQWSYRMEG